jgi:hypothetical protein
MKKLARAAFLLAMTGMLAGCSSASKTVTTTCSGDIVDGLPTSITVSAPSADDEISEMIMNITMTADFFGLEGDLDTDTIKNSGLDSLLASMLGVEESDLQVTYGKDSVEVKITASSADDIRTLLNLDSSAALTYSDVVNDLETSTGLSCD